MITKLLDHIFKCFFMLYLNIFNAVLDYLRMKFQVFKNYFNKIYFLTQYMMKFWIEVLLVDK